MDGSASQEQRNFFFFYVSRVFQNRKNITSNKIFKNSSHKIFIIKYLKFAFNKTFKKCF